METGAVIIGLIVCVPGLVFLRYPYRVARLHEQIDAIGSTRRFGSVEPAGWLVLWTRVVGGLILVAGVILIFIGFTN